MTYGHECEVESKQLIFKCHAKLRFATLYKPIFTKQHIWFQELK